MTKLLKSMHKENSSKEKPEQVLVTNSMSLWDEVNSKIHNYDNF